MTILEIENNESTDEPVLIPGADADYDGNVFKPKWSAKLHKKALKKRGKRRHKSRAVPKKKWRRAFFNPIFTFTEHYSRPFSDFMKSWAALAFKDPSDSETPVVFPVGAEAEVSPDKSVITLTVEFDYDAIKDAE